MSWSASAAIGSGNHLRSYYSLAVGSGNFIETEASAAFGNMNNLQAFYSMAVGSGNSSYSSSEEGSGNTSMMVGAYNYLDLSATSSIAVGSGNVIGVADSNYPVTEAVALFGRGLYNYGLSHVTIVGRYNLVDGISNARFIVGNGASATSRSNALVVYANGSAKFAGEVTIPRIPPQGDIAMGVFGE